MFIFANVSSSTPQNRTSCCTSCRFTANSGAGTRPTTAGERCPADALKSCAAQLTACGATDMAVTTPSMCCPTCLRPETVCTPTQVGHEESACMFTWKTKRCNTFFALECNTCCIYILILFCFEWRLSDGRMAPCSSGSFYRFFQQNFLSPDFFPRFFSPTPELSFSSPFTSHISLSKRPLFSQPSNQIITAITGDRVQVAAASVRRRRTAVVCQGRVLRLVQDGAARRARVRAGVLGHAGTAVMQYAFSLVCVRNATLKIELWGRRVGYI
jgi:hypothetical protein